MDFSFRYDDAENNWGFGVLGSSAEKELPKYNMFSTVLRIRIRDPGSGIGAFLTPGSGIRDPE